MMRRWLLLIFALLWLGLATTVGLAWLASITPIHLDRHRLHLGCTKIYAAHNGWAIRGWSTPLRDAWFLEPGADNDSSTAEFDVPTWSVAAQPASADDRLTFEYTAGWPWKCFRICWKEHGYDGPCLLEDLIEGGIPADGFEPDWLVGPPPDYSGMFVSFDHDMHDLGEQHGFPTTPIWPGFIGNVVVWALLWAPLLFLLTVLPTMRRVWRKRRNRCIRCKYSLRGIESCNCPECGWNVSQRYPTVTVGRMITAFALAIGLTSFVIWAAYNRSIATEDIAPLHVAARFNDVARIEELLDGGASADQPMLNVHSATFNNDATTPLHWATRYGSTESVALLIEAGADPNYADPWHLRPLSQAAMHGHADVIRVLLDAGVPPDEPQRWGETPLPLAAKACCIPCMELLIDAGAPLYTAGKKSGPTALTEAASVGCNEAIELLNDQRMNFSWKYIENPLPAAAANAHLSTIELLLAVGFDVDQAGPTTVTDQWATPIEAAVISGDIDTVRMLIEYGADLGSDAGAIVWQAIDSDKIDIAQLLIQSGADPNYSE